MKKSKVAVKSSVKKVSKNKKPISSLLKKALKKPLGKLLVKMSSKAKKPQVKVPAKPAAKVAAKPATKALKPTKVLPVKTVKTAPVKPAAVVKPADKKTLAKTPVAAPVKDLKKAGKVSAAPVVAAVLAKPLTKPAKVAKPVKAAKTGSSSERMCRELACENVATTKGFCRLDYIKNWKKIKRKEMILKEGKLNQYIEELVGKYPDKYIDVIRQDLSTEVNFTKVIHDLELDESIDDLDYDGDSIDALIGGIKKEIEDFGDEEF